MKRKIMKVLVNGLTLTRLIATFALIPIFINFGALTASIFLGSVFLTDFFDGYLARKFDVQTYLGAFLDQACDKLLSLTSLICLATVNPLFYIPVMLETSITLINIKNDANQIHTNSSMMGRVKMWVLGIAIILGFSTQEIMTNPELSRYITNEVANNVSNIAAVISSAFCLATIHSYSEPKQEKKEYTEKELKDFDEIWNNLLSSRFKEENPNIPKSDLIFKRIKKGE